MLKLLNAGCVCNRQWDWYSYHMYTCATFAMQIITWLCFWPPFSLTKLTACCWSVRCKAFRNLTHWSSVVNRSSKASFLLNTVLSLRISVRCLSFKTWSPRRWSRSQKSGSMKYERTDFSAITADKMPVLTSVWITTHHYKYIVTVTSCHMQWFCGWRGLRKVASVGL